MIRREACKGREAEVGSAGCAWVHNSAVASDDGDSCDEVRPAASIAACAAMSEVAIEFCDSAGSP